MKIFLLLSHTYCGGLERLFAELLENLPEKIERLGIQTYYCNQTYVNNRKKILFNETSSKILRFFQSVLLIPLYVHNMRKQHPDISLSLSPVESIANIISSHIMKNIPVVSFHIQPELMCSGSLSKIQFHILIWLIRKFRTHVIVDSSEIKKTLVNNYNISIDIVHVIYNPIDLSRIKQLSEMSIPNNPTLEKPIIITAGRLSSEKAQQHIIRVFAHYRKRHKGTLIICGDGPERSYLENLSREYGIENNVLFLGWVTNPYMYISKSDLFVLSSIYESLPTVLIESLVCGCPVVSSNCSPGVLEILGSNGLCGFISSKVSGIKYSSKDLLDNGEINFLQNILKILENPNLHQKMINNGIERGGIFNLESGISEYVAFFERLLIEF